MNSIEFETELAAQRERMYRYRRMSDEDLSFRPLSGMPADFTVVTHAGRHHFFYIERRLTEATPFFPGNEIYFGHASTANLFDWEVHDPVLLILPETWEGAHVWAPTILRRDGRFVMAYTGLNTQLSQDLGLAFSDDLFTWVRATTNPISPAADRAWSAWRRDAIASCRDPHLLAHDGRTWMTYTTNTREGASCVALSSTADLIEWDDHGPILVGPTDGYAVNPWGGHPQGQIESSHLHRRGDRWTLLVKFAGATDPARNWILESDRMDRFEFAGGREFWPGAVSVEVVAERGDQALLATHGPIRFGVVDWSAPRPVARFVSADELREWSDAAKGGASG